MNIFKSLLFCFFITLIGCSENNNFESGLYQGTVDEENIRRVEGGLNMSVDGLEYTVATFQVQEYLNSDDKKVVRITSTSPNLANMDFTFTGDLEVGVPYSFDTDSDKVTAEYRSFQYPIGKGVLTKGTISFSQFDTNSGIIKGVFSGELFDGTIIDESNFEFSYLPDFFRATLANGTEFEPVTTNILFFEQGEGDEKASFFTVISTDEDLNSVALTVKGSLRRGTFTFSETSQNQAVYTTSNSVKNGLSGSLKITKQNNTSKYVQGVYDFTTVSGEISGAFSLHY